MEYDIEKILYTFEDDYNPSSKVPGPRNMDQEPRIPFGDGSITPVRNKSKNVVGEKLRLFNQDKLYHLRLGADKKNYYGTKEQLEEIFKNRKTSGGTKIDTKSKTYKNLFPTVMEQKKIYLLK